MTRRPNQLALLPQSSIFTTHTIKALRKSQWPRPRHFTDIPHGRAGHARPPAKDLNPKPSCKRRPHAKTATRPACRWHLLLLDGAVDFLDCLRDLLERLLLLLVDLRRKFSACSATRLGHTRAGSKQASKQATPHLPRLAASKKASKQASEQASKQASKQRLTCLV